MVGIKTPKGEHENYIHPQVETPYIFHSHGTQDGEFLGSIFYFTEPNQKKGMVGWDVKPDCWLFVGYF